jgi:hypothetical protein
LMAMGALSFEKVGTVAGARTRAGR